MWISVVDKIDNGGFKMKTTIVYTHPWDGSFNHHVLEVTKAQLLAKGHDVDVIDLHQDGFDPAFHAEDLKLFGKGEYNDPKAEDYMKRLKASDEVIFVFPVWWYGAPAMLKGFFDKVFLKGHTYDMDENHNLVGKLGINKAAVFTTGNISKEIFEHIGDPINKTMIEALFGTVGIKNVTWLHCKTVHMEETRNQFLSEIEQYLK